METYTEIISNGSKWYGEEPDTVEVLLDVLENHPLDRVFESYGNFAYRAKNKHDREIMGNSTRFFGNFLTISHVFNIQTNDNDLITKLCKAIRKNKRRPDYLSQPKPLKQKKFFED